MFKFAESCSQFVIELGKKKVYNYNVKLNEKH